MIDLVCTYEDMSESTHKSEQQLSHGSGIQCVNVFQSQEEERMQTFTKAWIELMNGVE